MKVRKTRKQLENLKYNEKRYFVYLSGFSKNIVDKIKENPEILTRKNPRWTCFSHYISYCLYRDFGKKQNIQDRESELKEMIQTHRNEIISYVSEKNKEIELLEGKLCLLREENKQELAILRRPEHKQELGVTE